MTQITNTGTVSENEEATYRAEMDNYAPIDTPAEQSENDIGFNFLMYPTLHRMALSDARIKVAIGPAGCLDRDTEVLTPNGWVSIAEAPDVIMVYDPNTKTGYFSKSEHLRYECPEKLHRFTTSYALDMVVSDEHKVWYQTLYSQNRGENKWQIITGAELAEQFKSGTKRSAKIPTVFDYNSDTEYPLTDAQLRVQVMVSADGSLVKHSKRVDVCVRKERKKERIRLLLDEAGIDYTEVTYPQRPTETHFRFTPPEYNKDLSKYYSASKRQLLLMAEESLLWDGNIGEKGSYYCSAKKANVDFIQFAFVSNGIPSVITSEEYDDPNWNTSYRATVGVNKKTSWVNMKTAEYEAVSSPDGYKYCYMTPTGMFVARRNGKIFCTGNSAKTSGIIWQILIAAMSQQAAKDGVRYSRCLVVRNTYQMLKSTTIPSFKTMLGNLMSFRLGGFPLMGHARFDLNDGTKVHLDVEFVAVDSEQAQNKLLGAEPTFAFVDEISEIPEHLIYAIDRRLGRYPSGRFGKASWVGMWCATNGPLKNHWLYDWYMGKKDKEFGVISQNIGRPYMEIFKQPPALLEQPDGTWLPNAAAENIENLPNGYGYYYAQLGAEREKINAYVLGDFSDLRVGKVVFPEFNEERHVIPEFNVPAGAPLYLSFDFGRTPVCLVSTMTAGGRVIVVDEIMGEDMSIDTLIVEHVKPVLRTQFPHNMVAGATADPAGLVEAQSVDVSPYDVLLKHGIPVEHPGTNKLQPRLEAVKQYLTKLDRSGNPMLQVTKNCKYLIAAMKYNYVYESVRGRNGVFKDTPTKTHEGWASDLCDALTYKCLYTGLKNRMQTKTTRSSTKRARFI